MNRILEVCVDSLASARAAIAGGADRLELCSALSVGGLTPWGALLRQIRRESSVPIRCMLRPRPGDFLYTREELDLMRLQLEELNQYHPDGFVFGCLTPGGELDEAALSPLLAAAKGKPCTLHRAIDVSRNPENSYRRAAALGFATVLTSGGRADCQSGMDTIGRLLELEAAAGGPEVLIGAGVKAPVIRAFRRQLPRSHAFHLSGKESLESGMQFRRADVPMGLPGLDEWHIQQTSEDAVRAARAALDCDE